MRKRPGDQAATHRETPRSNSLASGAQQHWEFIRYRQIPSLRTDDQLSLRPFLRWTHGPSPVRSLSTCLRCARGASLLRATPCDPDGIACSWRGWPGVKWHALAVCGQKRQVLTSAESKPADPRHRRDQDGGFWSATKSRQRIPTPVGGEAANSHHRQGRDRGFLPAGGRDRGSERGHRHESAVSTRPALKGGVFVQVRASSLLE